ncbi:MAG: amidase, partial [Acetobacteraceae bacterium]|nr:amidase [Acetobacteraceae bacterium]
MSDPADLTAVAAVRAIRAGSLSPAALLEACLARLAARERLVQAMAYFDPAQVRAASARTGPLHGLPIGVKDVIDTADMPSEYGSPIWRGHRPRADAACVAWARAAGAVVLGKTVTTEFATRFPGPTTNPHDPARTPGGSSSGSAAGVACGYFPLAYGTQTAGSIIRPAAYCGVVGYKPSFGTINRFGMKLMSESLDTVGVIARAVADCALLTSAVTGLDLGDPDAKPDRAPRIGICRSPVWDRAAPETRALFEWAPEALARAGAELRDLALPAVFEQLEAAHAVVMNAESARALGWE